MRRVLFLSYYFPPIGGAGAQRPLKMVRYLVEAGWLSCVVTGPGPTVDRWAPEDATMADEVPPGIEVRRIDGPEPRPSVGWRRRAERWLGIRAPWDEWLVEGSVRTGLAGGGDVDLVYVWMQPYSAAAAGARLAEALGRPWVADLGDPWALDEMRIYASRLHRRRDADAMRRNLASAAAVVMSTQEAADRLREAAPELADTPVFVIPNGFDSADFDGPVRPRADGRFRIVHTGYLHTELGLAQRRWRPLRRILGGSVSGLDIGTRSHVYLLEAIDRLVTERPELADRVEVHLAGVLSPLDVAIADRSPATRLHGYVSHAESVELMRTADLLFLPMQNLPLGRRATIVPGKTYEYLAAETPILAAVPDGDARDILAEVGAHLCRPDDVDGMAALIGDLVDRPPAERTVDARRAAVAARFEYRVLAERLAAVFDGVLAAASHGRGTPAGAPAGQQLPERLGAASAGR